MSFANSETAWLEWCVVIHFPTEPEVTTTVDVHDKGDIPILLSLPQMMNLGFKLDMDPKNIHLTCKALGYERERLPFTTSRHVVVDLAHLHGKVKQSDLILKQAFSITDSEQTFSASEGMSMPASDEQQRRKRMNEKTTPSKRQIDGSNTKPAQAKEKSTSNKQKKRGDPDKIYEFEKDFPFGDSEPESNTKIEVKTEIEPSSPEYDPGDDVVVKSEPRTDDDVEIVEPKATVSKAKSALQKVHDKLRDKAELLKLHLQHHHMTLKLSLIHI